ncbi:MAG: hypothetical protein A2126_01390 [Candidatus Woykebacteria bacterium GWB1_45_5]|uniref:DUF5667 domain-containing protein n=1 Tax=Candidatus Woykebacteria bacterium GWB1_45_5 TaxID=1802592 RepID=A0A1G1W7W8_9BACT|nr:MAG: hypothetical protein A2126_01390 [Candidatus Woykebacteria bacterium GWB1_45_5]
MDDLEEKLLQRFKPDPTWRANLRATLVSKYSQETSSPKFGLWWRASFATLLTIVFLTAGTVTLAENSVPGDFLYPTKRGVENLRVTFASSEDKISLHQEFTERRIDELKKLVDQERYQQINQAMGEIVNSISTLNQDLPEVSSQLEASQEDGNNSQQIKESLEELVSSVDENQKELSDLEQSLPEDSRDDLQEVQESLEDLQAKATESLETLSEPEENE